MLDLKQLETPTMTVLQFLEWDNGTDSRYELVNGKIKAMAPPTPIHGKIAAKLTAAIQRRLKPPCEVILEAGICLPETMDLYYQADLAVSCVPVGREDRYVSEPIVIIEILSHSTQAHDRGIKVPDYRTLASVREIVLVSSTAIHIELWRRTANGWLVLDWIGRNTQLVLESLGVELLVAEVYAGIDFIG